MSTEQRERIGALKAERAKLTSPLARIAFDNDARNGTFAERIVAMTECPHGSYRFGERRNIVCTLCGEIVYPA